MLPTIATSINNITLNILSEYVKLNVTNDEKKYTYLNHNNLYQIFFRHTASEYIKNK